MRPGRPSPLHARARPGTTALLIAGAWVHDPRSPCESSQGAMHPGMPLETSGRCLSMESGQTSCRPPGPANRRLFTSTAEPQPLGKPPVCGPVTFLPSGGV